MSPLKPLAWPSSKRQIMEVIKVDWLELKICSSTLFFGTSGRRCSRSEVIGVARLEETNNEGQWGRLARIENLFIYTIFWHEWSALQSVARSTGSN